MHNERAERVKAWLRGLADGYVLFDPDDVFAKVEGPAVVAEVGGGGFAEDDELSAAAERLLSHAGAGEPLSEGAGSSMELHSAHAGLFRLSKPYFVGQKSLVAALATDGRPEFVVGGHVLSAIKALDEKSAKILWKRSIPGGSRTPAIADVDGDGTARSSWDVATARCGSSSSRAGGPAGDGGQYISTYK